MSDGGGRHELAIYLEKVEQNSEAVEKWEKTLCFPAIVCTSAVRPVIRLQVGQTNSTSWFCLSI